MRSVASSSAQGDATDIVLVDLPAFREQRRLRIDRFRAKDALSVTDGWIVVGDARSGCNDRHAAAYTVASDGTVAPLWRDASPFDTFGRGLRKSAGAIEIVAHARRSVAIREEATAVQVPDFSTMRGGDEGYLSGEVFSVRLSAQGREERRDFVGAGLPVVPMGMVSIGERSAIFGTVGGRPLWMAR